jgi:hypothetical protein
MNIKKWIKIEYKDGDRNKVRFNKVKDIDSVSIIDNIVTFTKKSGFPQKNNVTNIKEIFDKVIVNNLA